MLWFVSVSFLFNILGDYFILTQRGFCLFCLQLCGIPLDECIAGVPQLVLAVKRTFMAHLPSSRRTLRSKIISFLFVSFETGSHVA